MTIGQVGFDWGFFRAIFVENSGMAFGKTIPFLPESTAKITLSVFRLVAVVLGVFYIKNQIKKGVSKLFIICASLVLAGAIGNLLDGAFYGIIFSETTRFEVAEFLSADGGYQPFMMGYVVDMFQFTSTWPSWMPFGLGGEEIFPLVFNIADASISIGIVIIVIWQKKLFKNRDKVLAASTSSEIANEDFKKSEINSNSSDVVFKLSNHNFLTVMYEDDYYPNHLVDKCKNVLIELCLALENKDQLSKEAFLSLTHKATEKINTLESDFSHHNSEIETVARENIAEEFALIANTYGFGDIDVEELIANRNW